MSLAVMNGNNHNTPNDQGAKVARKAALDASRDLPGNKRKLSAYHPTLGYAIPPPQPAKVARRNARERNRVKQVNCGFEVLRTHIPTAVKHKKMSKVDTLRHAVDYIQNLKRLLGEQEDSDLDESSCNNRSLCETPELKPHIQADQGLHNSQVPSSSSSYYGNHYSQYPQTPQFTHPSPQQSAVHQRPQHIQTYPESYESPSYYSGSSSSYSYNPSMPRDGSASPSSPGVYSDYGPCNSLPNSSNPTPYLTTSLDDFYNPEEDEILDAIVKWQED